LEFNLRFLNRRSGGPGAKGLAKPGFHGCGVEVTGHTQNNVIGMNMRAMPIKQVLPGDGSDGFILRNTRIGTLRTVSQFGRLAGGDSTEETDKRDGKVISVSKMNVAPDRKTMTIQWTTNSAARPRPISPRSSSWLDADERSGTPRVTWM